MQSRGWSSGSNVFSLRTLILLDALVIRLLFMIVAVYLGVWCRVDFSLYLFCFSKYPQSIGWLLVKGKLHLQVMSAESESVGGFRPQSTRKWAYHSSVAGGYITCYLRNTSESPACTVSVVGLHSGWSKKNVRKKNLWFCCINFVSFCPLWVQHCHWGTKLNQWSSPLDHIVYSYTGIGTVVVAVG